ncbi:MAG: hypothetical protein ABI873_16385, partial [Marmoricola sp.]
FSITGRVSKRPGALRFPAVQRYETSTESWNGSEASQHPAPTLVVSRAAAAATSGSAVPQVPLAAQPRQVGQGGTDSLARSRADLALMLALAALVAMSGLVALTVLRRRPAVERSGGAAKPVVDPTEPVAPPRRPRKAKRRS